MIMNPMMMKKIQKMQKDMLKAQKDIEESVFTGSAAGGMVTIEVKGTKEINKVNINPSVVDPEDVEMLEDVILLALNDAFRQVDEKTESTMGQFTKGMNIPGLF
ncbi:MULTISPECIES: YbaB/EbfC family nucleoid-associated protein [Turicibacter]|uniref:Nucleoid-associated protein CUW_2622 n=2 Tax=Turicibacter sanguinis TaxID=154288 RepID=A0ABP2I6K1_9FIRM|nr:MULTISPECIES: YbaB/EbfC family nucleoid-associated protein [Turicibacter]EFF64477.1 DNA-binding protein, YbaB/EbfC family [Turicibacter sanguinis PC909]EGC91558.1 DNA-binding protein, YbaB/EbfC family [Turicibacter sp. HGF1]MBP3903538.1 YbaB/EbfC family nucleoid-associated protein [Turicibacter sp.]MCU7192214.1 YbaB/EbfC family nucleoid-associated protein [Turicibacter sanguinis]MCU7197730.1 YbaB/EbfC family nucleoid-associated protein [Turicibacter sanguinis]